MVESQNKNTKTSPTKRFSFSGFFSRKSKSSSFPSISTEDKLSDAENSPANQEKKKKWFGRNKSSKKEKNPVTKTRSDANVNYPSRPAQEDKRSSYSTTPTSQNSKASKDTIKTKEEKKREDGSSAGVVSPDKEKKEEKNNENESISAIRKISKRILTKVPSKSEKDKGRQDPNEFPPSPLLFSSSSIKVSNPVPLPQTPKSVSSYRSNRNSMNISSLKPMSPRNLPALTAKSGAREFRTKERKSRIPNLGASSNFTTSASSFGTRRMGDNSEATSISSFDYVKRRINHGHVRSPLLAQALEKSLTKEHFSELMSGSQYGENESALSYEDSGNFDVAESKGGMPKTVAIFDFAGERMDDLTFWEGDVIVILAMFDDGWWLGLRVESNQIGRIPSNFVEPLPNGSQVVRALSDYTSGEEDDIEFEEGDILIITHKNGDWWFGELDGRSGWIPSNYVEDIDLVLREQYMTST